MQCQSNKRIQHIEPCTWKSVKWCDLSFELKLLESEIDLNARTSSFHVTFFHIQGGTWSSILLLDQVVDWRRENRNTTKNFKDGDVIFDSLKLLVY